MVVGYESIGVTSDGKKCRVFLIDDIDLNVSKSKENNIKMLRTIEPITGTVTSLWECD